MKLVLREVRRFARSHVKELRVGPVVEPDAAHDDREPGAVWISRQGLRLNALGDLAGSAENETDPDQHVNWNPLHIENHEPELHVVCLEVDPTIVFEREDLLARCPYPEPLLELGLALKLRLGDTRDLAHDLHVCFF